MLTETDRRALQALEEALLQPGVRRDAARLDQLIADDFMEIGASGRRYDKREVIGLLLEEESPGQVEAAGFEARSLAADLALLTYSTDREGRRVLRSSIWRRSAGGWQVVFHQGTPVPES